MNALILSLFLTLNDYVPTNIEPFFEAKKAESGLVKIPKSIWEDLNKGRKLMGRPTLPLETVNSHEFHNRDYVTDWVNLTAHELSEVLKHEPAEEQVFIGWYLGLKAFKKLDYDIAKVKDETVLLKLELFKRTKKNNSRASIHEPPPPLPSDGRPIVPRRYQSDWTRPEQRSSYK